MTVSEAPELLTVEQAAEMLGVERHHLMKLINSGILPSVRLSPRVLRIPRWLLVKRLEEMAGAVQKGNENEIR